MAGLAQGGSRRTRVAVAFLVAGLLLIPPAATAAPRTLRPLRVAHVVTLITGERVLVGRSSTGVPTARIIRAHQHGLASQLTTMSLGGHRYVIPASARPYLGRYLDPSLFDVTRARGRSARVPLRITYHGSVPTLPGVIVTAAHGGVARAYVTPSSARRFGAALARQALADARAGWPRSSRLFGSINRIAPAAVVRHTVHPRYPMVTLIVKGISKTGGNIPFSFGFLENEDNGAKFANFVVLFHGEARVSLPRGHYMGVFDQSSFVGDGISFRVMPVTDYHVAGPGQTLTVDARDATVAPSLSTPKAAALQELDVTLDGQDAKERSGFSWGYGVGEGSQIRLEPTPAPAAGTLTQTTRWIEVDPSVPGGRYSYDASYVDQGVPSSQSHSVPGPGGTNTVNATYDADRSLRVGATARFVILPTQFFAIASFYPLAMPTHRTDYIVAPPRATVQDLVLSDLRAYDPGEYDGPTLGFSPGSVRDEHWLRGPFGVAVPATSPSDRFPLCYACRSRHSMTFAQLPNDGDPLHVGFPYGGPHGATVAHFRVYRDGTLLLQSRNRLGDVFDVPAGDATYRVETDLDRQWTDADLSTFTRTNVTFRADDATGAPLPPTWYCLSGRKCQVLPVLRTAIDLHASPQGSVPVGTTIFDLTVGHIENAMDPAITSVSVSVRPSGASKWMTVPVSAAGSGHYRAAFLARPRLKGRAMDLVVSARDADGGVLRQMTARAFRVAS